MREIARLVLFAVVAGGCAFANPGSLEPTTLSKPARQSFEMGMMRLEDARNEEALAQWRTAIKQDPNLALAYAFIAQTTSDPAEQATARDKAKTLAPKASAGEQLMIRWITGTQESEFVPAIAALNDLVSKFPQDKRVLFLAARWFSIQGEHERAQQLAEASLKIDPKYTPAMNTLGYNYARMGQLDKAINTMEQYLKLAPGNPNPQDSYAEMLRIEGRFDGALEHYRAAIALDPRHYRSQLGLADTYALMGKQAEARQEYAKAIPLATNAANRLDASMRNAITYVREGDLKAADEQFDQLVAQARTSKLGRWEARLLRVQAMYQKDNETALQALNAAERALGAQPMSQTAQNEELATIRRDRVLRQCAAHRLEQAKKTLAVLEESTQGNRDVVVHAAYHIAQGAVLIGEKKFGQAVEQLYEDQNNPLAMQLLGQAFEKMKARGEAENMRTKLAHFYRPTIEQAVTRTVPVAAER